MEKLRKTPKTKEGIPKKYLPKSLTPADRKKQLNSIKEGKKRPRVKSYKSKSSTHKEKFEKKYGYKISNFTRINKEILDKKGIDLILSKGKGAYYSGGSRPNQTPESWALGRLASVIMGGNARKVDQEIWNKYKKI